MLLQRAVTSSRDQPEKMCLNRAQTGGAFLALLLTAASCTEEEQAAAPQQSALTREQLARDNSMFLNSAIAALQWDEPAEALHIAGPLYFVGTKGLGSYLITTPEGHILLGTGTASSGPLIAESITALGFRPEDIRVLLTWHAHADHAGAIAYFQELSGAQVAIMADDVAAMEDGGRSDFHYGWDWRTMGFPAVKVDRVLHDGDDVAVGGVTMTALNTPGHTRGDTTWTMQVEDNGRTYLVVWPDGMSVNPGYRLERNPSYPGIADDYRRTFARLDALEPDIWLVSHTERFNFEGKRARAALLGAEAFVDRDGYHRYVAEQRAAFEDALEAERAAPTAEDGVRRGMATEEERLSGRAL
jgi:metallo-beta-lactamase class B